MTTTQITPQLKVTMLKLLVQGRDLGFVSIATKVPRDKVLDIVSTHGYPDHDRMGWAVDMLIQGGDKIPTSTLRTGTPLDGPATNIRSAQSTGHQPGPRNPGYAVIAPATGRPAHTSVSELLHQAGESDVARTRNLGAKISALVADLTARLADEQEAHEAKNKALRESAAVAARIAVLQAEIDKLKGKRSKPARTTTGIVSTPRESVGPSESAVIRAWAKANNVPCPPFGAVNKAVRDAYHAATDAT